MLIGVLSDTHNFLDPRIPQIFAGVEHILHAGDIGLPKVILALEQIAPVTAVTGNTDDPGLRYSQAETIELAGFKFLVNHIANPHEPDEILKARLTTHKPDVVVFGHTHKPFTQTIGGTLFLNPGYAGKPRLGLPRTVALLRCDARGIQVEYQAL